MLIEIKIDSRIVAILENVKKELPIVQKQYFNMYFVSIVLVLITCEYIMATIIKNQAGRLKFGNKFKISVPLPSKGINIHSTSIK